MISAIVPVCNEYPQILFTVQSLLEEGADEVIVIGNKCTDKTNKYFSALKNPKVRYFVKDDRLSHWQAKNLGIEKSKGDLLFFCDGHCIVGRDTLKYLSGFITDKTCPAAKRIGGLHCVVHYILDSRGLEYEFRPEEFYYRFCTARQAQEPYEVPVMSTCGMMCTKSVIEKLGGWNKELGIYSGGEQYFNFKQATCGYPQYIHPKARIWHYAEKRGYCWNYDDFVRNTFIAAYCIGGEELLEKQVALRKVKDRPDVIDALADDVRIKCETDRNFIKDNQVMTYDKYVDYWQR